MSDYHSIIKQLNEEFETLSKELDRLSDIKALRSIDELDQVLMDTRKKQQITLQQLSELADVSAGTLSKIENNQAQNIQLGNLKKALGTLGLRLWIG